MDLTMVRAKRHLALVPATLLDEDRLRAIRTWEPMQVQANFTRTSKLNRWYRGLVGKVAEAIGVPPDLLHNDLKFKAGLILQIMPIGVAGEGAIAVRLKSTAFPLMQDPEFSAYCDVAVELMFRDYLPDVRAREQQKLILEWAGRRPKLDPQARHQGLMH
jgi:hypothetical protein